MGYHTKWKDNDTELYVVMRYVSYLDDKPNMYEYVSGYKSYGKMDNGLLRLTNITWDRSIDSRYTYKSLVQAKRVIKSVKAVSNKNFDYRIVAIKPSYHIINIID